MSFARQAPVSQMMRLPLDVLERELAQRTNVPGTSIYPAVFVDRDGTINVEKGYLDHPGNVALLPTSGQALRLLNRLSIPVVVITNQSALERGLMKLDGFESVNAAIWQALQASDAYYDALYYCPHTPDRTSPCACRKPQPGLLLQAAFDLDLDLRQCFLVGDKRSDIEAGRACGCQSILVRTGYGENAYLDIAAWEHQPDYMASTLLEASQWIASRLQRVQPR